MRVLLAAPHRYPAGGNTGSGLHPREYPSGSGYHLHDLLARGLAEEGHEVLYYLGKGAEIPLPPGVRLVDALTAGCDLCHAPIGPSEFTDRFVQFAETSGVKALLTCHMKQAGKIAGANWIFVARALASSYGSDRVVLNGVDPGDLAYSEVKEDYLLFLGAMNKAIDKGLDVALSVARASGRRLIVAGTGLDYETIAHVTGLCREAGAEYVGDVRGARKAGLIAGASALLFPSRLLEGCPLVILEAMMSGTPVISSRSGGAVEIVTTETGVLCDGEQAWLDAVERIPTISPARCREIAMKQWHYRRMVSDYLQEYRQELERSQR
jgi:glycosyltransferase involved in cell wall biosynthesis